MARSLLIFALLVAPASTLGQQTTEKESVAVLELGAVGARNLKSTAFGFGPTVAVEFTPIEHWLEIESGVTPLFSRHSSEWTTELLLKKPWTVSKKIEFMAGVGPEWIHARESNTSTNSLGAEAALDFMFWQSSKHRFGWYLEPAYEYNFGPGRERSLGISIGLLFALP